MQRGYPPSMREIADAVGLRSTATVHAYMIQLERRGLIRRDPAKPRAVEVVHDPSLTLRRHMVLVVPLDGQRDQSMLYLPPDMAGRGQILSLWLDRDLASHGLNAGDRLLIRGQSYVPAGELAVFREEDRWLVRPARGGDHCAVGRVIGYFRRLS